MGKSKPAITLFITLAVIAAMLALVGVVFKYLTDARAKAQDKSALIEANLIYTDARSTLEKFLGKKPSVGTLKNIYKIPLNVQTKKGDFNLLVACAPTHAAIPITWFKNKGSKNQDRFNLANYVLDDIALKFQLKDGSKLSQMLTQALNSAQSFEFGKFARLQRAKNFFSYGQFLKILRQYSLEEDDSNVFKVNWKSYFSFGQDYKAIDGEFLSAKLISIIFNIDEQIVQEDFKSGELERFLYRNGADLALYKSPLFAKGAVAAMRCSASYTFGSRSYSISFEYNEGKVGNFEFLY